jgi:hypothetical protein
MVPKQSRLPWSIRDGFSAGGYPFFEIRDVEGFIVLSIRGGSIPVAADIATILQAVNTYQGIKDALGTDEDGEALVRVARAAHTAEQELAAKIRHEEE